MKIIINRSDAIGDTLLTSPMAQLIKEKIPKARVIYIISPKCQGLFDQHPYIDECWILDKKKSRIRNFFKMIRLFNKGGRAGAYFHVGGSSIPTIVAATLFIRIRAGLKSKPSTLLFLNKGTRQKRSMVEMHETDYNLALLRPLNICYHYKNRSTYAPVISISEQERQQVQNQFSTAKDLVFIHPGMVGHTLNWSSRNYARLALRLDQKYPGRFAFVISHTPGDKKYIEAFQDELSIMPEKIADLIYFDGSVEGLRNYMANLQRATLFVGPSTGTTHIANALGVPQVAIYSPIKVQSAMRWGPFNRDKKSCRVVIPQAVCGEVTKCAKESCPYYKCMAKIEVEEVLEQAIELISEKDHG